MVTQDKYEPLFVGRTEELAQVEELAVRGRHVLVMGGIGKSALLERCFQALRNLEEAYVFRVGECRQFKNVLLDLAEQMHRRGIYRHPGIPAESVEAPTWQRLTPRVRGLTVSELAQTIILSLSERRLILVWDYLEQGTPGRRRPGSIISSKWLRSWSRPPSRRARS